MAMDLTWILSAKDSASSVFDKVKQSGEGAAKGVEGAFGGVMNKFNLVTGAVGAMAAITAGGVFKSVIQETIAWTGEAVSLSKALGINTAEASILNVALGDVYLSKETMLAGASRITKTLKAEEEAFQKLGVATRDQSGHYRSTLDIMTDVNTKLGTLKEGTDRNVAGMSIYGKSWQEMSSLIKLNNDVMDEAKKKAQELGLIVGDEQVAQMKKYKAAMNDIEDVGKSLALRFGNILLPNLVKVGAFFGTHGPILATAFDYTLKFLGKTVFTLGDYFGLLAYRAYSAFGIIKSVMTGNFAEAKTQWAAMVAAGDDFQKRTKDNWTNWKDQPVVAKAIKGDQLDQNFGQEDAIAAALKKRLDAFKENAKSILDVEKDRIKALIDIEKEYLGKLKTNYDTAVSHLDTFRAAYNSVLDSMAARDKTAAEEKAAALRVNEDSYTRYYRLQAELRNQEAAVDNDPAWTGESIAKKLKLYDDQITKAKELFDQAKAGNVENVSAEQAEFEYLEKKSRLEEKIKDLGTNQIKQQEDMAVKASEAVTLMERGIKAQEDQLKIVENMIKNIPNITEKELRIKVTGLADLYRIQALTQGANATTGGQYFGDYYTMGGNTYWSDGSLAESGTSVAIPEFATGTNRITRAGFAKVDEDEAIVPAKFNGKPYQPPGTSITLQGGINITIEGGNTSQQTADEIARQVYPALQKLARNQSR